MIKKILPFLIIAAIIFGIFKITSSPSAEIDDSQADILLFWGEGCPHCENVEEYITQNNIDDILTISRKEVYYNKRNQLLLTEKASECPEIDQSQGMGVPFAYFVANGTCQVGDTPIIQAIENLISLDQSDKINQ